MRRYMGRICLVSSDYTEVWDGREDKVMNGTGGSQGHLIRIWNGIEISKTCWILHDMVIHALGIH
jgi:hypothetical protein